MRTTVTLDPDTEALLRQTMALQKKSFKQALNEAVRRGLRKPGSSNTQPYRVKTFKSGFRPGIDPARLNQMTDELEIEEYRRKVSRHAE